MRTLLGALLCLASAAQSGTPTAGPSFDNESLRYNINWPSGLSLGESRLSASRSKPADGPESLSFEFSVEASIPGFQVLDRYHSQATPDLCSVEFGKELLHGKKKTSEKTTFGPGHDTATRETTGGGKTELKTPACGKDALSFLYYVRRELSQGRLPQRQTVLFGAPYEVRIEFAGTQSIPVGDTNKEADKLLVSAKGPASAINFEIFFLKDAARTPALVRVPLTLGAFTMELVK